MQFGFGNLFNKKVTLQDSGIVPDIIPEMFTEKTVIRVRPPPTLPYPADMQSAAGPEHNPEYGPGERRSATGGSGQIVDQARAEQHACVYQPWRRAVAATRQTTRRNEILSWSVCWTTCAARCRMLRVLVQVCFM